MKESDVNISSAVNVKQLVSVFDNSLYVDIFPNFNNLVSLIRQLSWTHFIVLIPINVVEYITDFSSKELLQKKLYKFHLESKNLIENRG